MEKLYAEAIVIGAGPAGLGVALGLARAGIDTVIFERQQQPGLVKRGETIRYHKEMEALLGQGFFDKITRHRINKRRYYSHTGLRFVDRTISSENLIIDWTELIETMCAVAQKAGVRIETGVNVSSLVKEDGCVKGVIAEKNGSVMELRSKAVFSYGGIDDPGAKLSGFDRTRIDFPIQKRLVTNYPGKQDRLEYHFHTGQEGLFAATIFPRGGHDAEIIMMRFKGDATPDIDWFSNNHPVFKEHIDGCQILYKLDTHIPMGGMINPPVSMPGLVMAGDALGHVQGRGGSGIRVSFLIGYSSGVYSAQALRSSGITQEIIPELNKKILKSPQMKELLFHNLIYTNVRQLLFKPASTPEKMDMLWPLLKVALR